MLTVPVFADFGPKPQFPVRVENGPEELYYLDILEEGAPCQYPDMAPGVLKGNYGEELERSWIFRTVGYGNGEEYWRNIISELRMAGYDYAVSIEHEDGLMSGREGLEKAISFLKNVLIYEDRGAMYWA